MRMCYTVLKASKGESAMIQATITEIGTEAINKEEPMLILFDKTATAALRKYSVIQEVSKDEPFL